MFRICVTLYVIDTFSLPGSFISCKNASNKLNFINFCSAVAKLSNYSDRKRDIPTGEFPTVIPFMRFCYYSL